MIDFFKEGISISFLQKRCRRVFRKKLKIGPYFLFEQNFLWKDDEKKGVRDVILMGDALLLLTNTFLWPRVGRYRFWVLSQGIKDLIVSVFKMDPRHISVIPRKLIRPSARKVRAWPDLDQKCTMVISSRLEEDKNIPFTLHFGNFLQKQYPKVEIAIFTSSESTSDLGKLISKFSWKKRPTFYGDKGLSWHKSVKLTNPFLVNFSTYPLEDFSVSVAQARELGWPLILSYWAVFRELHGPSIIKLEAEQIFEYNARKSKREKNKIVQQAVTDTLASMDSENFSIVEDSTELRLPRSITAKELVGLQTSWTEEKRSALINGILDRRTRHSNLIYKKIKKSLTDHISQ